MKQNFIKFLILFALTKPLWYFYQPYAAAPLGNQDLSFHQTAIWLVSKITNQKPYALLCIGLRKTNCYYLSSYNSRVLFAFLNLSIRERFKRMASVRTVFVRTLQISAFKCWSMLLLHAFQTSSNVENLHPQILKQVMKELRSLSCDPPEGIKILSNDEDITDIQATIEGPGMFL